MDLTCELSPLVYAELYKSLAGSGAFADTLTDRLALIEQQHDWLADTAALYDAAWKGMLAARTGPDGLTPLGEDHALLATWLLASLRGTPGSYEFGYDLRAAVTTRAFAEAADLPAPLPSQFRPVVMGWTLGAAIGDVDHELPVAPALMPADENVSAAYRGLVEHVLHLNKQSPPWPEMLGTATLWRGTGIAEGLAPDAGDGQAAVRRLIIECRNTVPEHLASQISRHFAEFTDHRNVLSHVANLHGKSRFVDVMDLARDWTQIRLTIMGITHFLCSQIAGEILDSRSRIVRPGTWDELTWELSIYTGT